MRAVRRAEVAEHEARAATMDARAIHQASEGHIVRAAHLEHKSREQRVDAMVDARHPMAVAAVRPPPVGTAVVVAEVAAMTHPRPPPVATAAVVATDVAVKEAELAALAAARRAPPRYPPYGVPAAPYGYPPAPAAVYQPPPPGAMYPPQAGYPPATYPGYP